MNTHNNFSSDRLSTRHLTPEGDEQLDDDYSAYDEDEVRNDIYELLMRDRASSQHQI